MASGQFRDADQSVVARVPRDLLSVPQAAARLSVGERYIRRLVAERRVPIYRVGRHVRISAADLDALTRIDPPAKPAPTVRKVVSRPTGPAGGARRGFGTVRQLRSGRWQARIWDPATGAQIPAPQTFDTRADAQRWLAEAQTDQARGGWVSPRSGQIPLSVYADEWLAHRVLQPRTAELYRHILDRHILPTLGATLLSDLSNRQIRLWHAPLAKKHPSTAAKAYRLLHAILNTAVTDELIARNPCQIPGAGVERAPERPVATMDQVDQLAAAITDRFRVLVLLGAWCSLRKEELLGLQRRDIDLEAGVLHIERALVQLRDGTLLLGPPKGPKGKRTVAIPPHLIGEVARHLATFVGAGPEAHVFAGAKGGLLRPHVLQSAWDQARQATGLNHLHLHDLRHSGNTWAASTGASTKELMARMGHTTSDAALRYQHASEDRDAEIAAALSAARSRPPRPAHATS